MNARVCAAVSAALSIPFAAAGQDGPCRYDQDVVESLAVGSATLALVSSQSGSLRIEGRAGLDQVRVSGVACASDEEYLDDLWVDVVASDREVRVDARYPDWDDGRDNSYARLDLLVEVPAGMDMEVRDGSGSLHVSDVGALRIDDGSGSLTVEGAAGPVDIHDGSGNLTVRGVGGDVELKDGSGSMDIIDVNGSVVLNDGSGSINGEEITGHFVVESTGSGGITVDGVGGDLRIHSKGNGQVRYSAVDGRVEVPERRRKRSRRN